MTIPLNALDRRKRHKVAVFLTTVFVFDPGERKIGERFALVINLQAAGLVVSGKTMRVRSRLMAAWVANAVPINIRHRLFSG
jgi:hypothetical protein